jgi:hypothetical protein
MMYRKFGRVGTPVAEIGIGTWGMGGWSGSDDEASRAALRRGLELGCNFLDTARAYGNGHSEKLIRDVLEGDGEEKEEHAWQQPVAEAQHLIDIHTRPGELVVDPFLGSGTTGVAAVRLDRRFTGGDVDPAAVRKSKARIAGTIPGCGTPGSADSNRRTSPPPRG